MTNQPTTGRPAGLFDRPAERFGVPARAGNVPQEDGAKAVRPFAARQATRIIEALRMYAAAHEGRLPRKLNDLTVPVPIDPVTGQPFTYALRDDTAVIEGPPLPGVVLRVEVKVAR